MLANEKSDSCFVLFLTYLAGGSSGIESDEASQANEE